MQENARGNLFYLEWKNARRAEIKSLRLSNVDHLDYRDDNHDRCLIRDTMFLLDP